LKSTYFSGFAYSEEKLVESMDVQNVLTWHTLHKSPKFLTQPADKHNMKTRLSLGSAVLLNLKTAACDVLPTTVYLMLGENCAGNCAFCTQARTRAESGSGDKKADQLSRVVWPEFPAKLILENLERYQDKYQRICLQCLNYPEMVEDIQNFLTALGARGIDVPVSVSCVPVSSETMLKFKELGVDQLSCALDGATPQIFDRVKGEERKGPFGWQHYRIALRESRKVFGKALTHLIIGLGETDREALALVDELNREGIQVSLFAFTQVGELGKELEPPSPLRYHALQLVLRLLYQGSLNFHQLDFDAEGGLVSTSISFQEIKHILARPGSWLRDVFSTFGCPGCNRPFYNERPSGPFYNYPSQPPLHETLDILGQLHGSGIFLP
jgi:lipoyl synthase